MNRIINRYGFLYLENPVLDVRFKGAIAMIYNKKINKSTICNCMKYKIEINTLKFGKDTVYRFLKFIYID